MIDVCSRKCFEIFLDYPDECEDEVFEMMDGEGGPVGDRGATSSDFAAPTSPSSKDDMQPHIRRPMNAFMIFR